MTKQTGAHILVLAGEERSEIMRFRQFGMSTAERRNFYLVNNASYVNPDLQADMTKPLPLADEQFDVIILKGYPFELGGCLQNISRLLKKGGVFMHFWGATNTADQINRLRPAFPQAYSFMPNLAEVENNAIKFYKGPHSALYNHIYPRNWVIAFKGGQAPSFERIYAELPSLAYVLKLVLNPAVNLQYQHLTSDLPKLLTAFENAIPIPRQEGMQAPNTEAYEARIAFKVLEDYLSHFKNSKNSPNLRDKMHQVIDIMRRELSTAQNPQRELLTQINTGLLSLLSDYPDTEALSPSQRCLSSAEKYGKPVLRDAVQGLIRAWQNDNIKEKPASTLNKSAPVKPTIKLLASKPANPPRRPVQLLAQTYARQERVGFWKSLGMMLYSLITTFSLRLYRDWLAQKRPIVKMPIEKFNTLQALQGGLNSSQSSHMAQANSAQPEISIGSNGQRFVFIARSQAEQLEASPERVKGVNFKR